MPKEPLFFSILHATARLEGWRPAYEAWKHSHAREVGSYEYILAIHESDWDKFLALNPDYNGADLGDDVDFRLVVNRGKNNATANWNKAAEEAVGDVLILAADDLFPCPAWDEKIQSRFAIYNIDPLETPAVLHISTGSPRDAELISHAIITAALYDSWGYFFYPEYESMFADDDLTAHAMLMDYVADGRDIVFEHRNAWLGKGEKDAVFLKQNRAEAYASGEMIFNRRKTERFGENLPPLEISEELRKRTDAEGKRVMDARKTLAVCTPGEWFSQMWLANWTQLVTKLLIAFNLQVLNSFSSSVYGTRNRMVEGLNALSPKPDYVLWIDDDNLLSLNNFVHLYHGLENNPDLDIVFGWCWINPDGFHLPAKTSVFRMEPGTYNSTSLKWEELKSSPHDLIPISWSGFPVCLMRYSVIEKVGKHPFNAILDPVFQYGMSGEDAAFCIRAIEAGCRIAVDRRVKVPHLKLQSAEPTDVPVEIFNTAGERVDIPRDKPLVTPPVAVPA